MRNPQLFLAGLSVFLIVVAGAVSAVRNQAEAVRTQQAETKLAFAVVRHHQNLLAASIPPRQRSAVDLPLLFSRL